MHRLLSGCFDMDLSDGQVIFRESFCFDHVDDISLVQFLRNMLDVAMSKSADTLTVPK